MNGLINIDPKEYGLEETKAADISKMFKPMLDKMESLETEFNNLSKMDINLTTCKKAKELRLKYVKVRTGTAKIHKELKAFYLQGGRFVDGWKNAQLMASQGVEEKLSNIEKHFENIEKQRIEDLQIYREKELEQYEPAAVPNNLGEMDETVWNSFLIGTIASFESKIEAERLENERIEAERIEAENQKEIKRLEDIKKEKERKKLEAENKKLKAIADQKEKERLEELRLATVEKANAEKKAHDLLLKEQAKSAQLKKEVEDARKAKEESELKELEKMRLEASAPDKEKVLAFADTLQTLEFPSMTTKHGSFMMKQVKMLLNKVDKYILESADKF